MPDTEKITELFKLQDDAAVKRHSKLEETSAKRHIEQIKETGDIKGDIKELTGTVGKLDTSITKLQDEQKTHGERIVAVEGKADTAREIADSANDKAQKVIESGALALDAEGMPKGSRYSRRQKDAAMCIGGTCVGGGGVYLIAKVILAKMGIDIP